MGANLGAPVANLDAALGMLAKLETVRIEAVSSLYISAPVGKLGQPDFVNIAVNLTAHYTPEELLEECLKIEDAFGRQRLERWGPRTMDIDILIAEGYSSNSEKVTIPHARMLERAFVLVPLAQIAPDLEVDAALPVSQALNAVREQRVELLWDRDWETKWRCSDTRQ